MKHPDRVFAIVGGWTAVAVSAVLWGIVIVACGLGLWMAFGGGR